jgi:hypothetical protein
MPRAGKLLFGNQEIAFYQMSARRRLPGGTGTWAMA